MQLKRLSTSEVESRTGAERVSTVVRKPPLCSQFLRTHAQRVSIRLSLCSQTKVAVRFPSSQSSFQPHPPTTRQTDQDSNEPHESTVFIRVPRSKAKSATMRSVGSFAGCRAPWRSRVVVDARLQSKRERRFWLGEHEGTRPRTPVKVLARARALDGPAFFNLLPRCENGDPRRKRAVSHM